MLTMTDIARLSGCSRSTVYAVLNGKSWVSEETRNRVRQVIRENRWEPDRLASGLVGGSTGLIALILKDILNPFNSRIVEGVHSILQPRRFNTLLLSTMDEHSRELEAVNIARSYRTDGIIIIPQQVGVDLEHLWRIRQGGEVCVTLGKCPGLNFPWVELEEARAAREVTEYLITLGHRRIGLLKGPSTSLSALEREAGFREGLVVHGVAADPSHIVSAGADLTSGYRAAAELLSRSSRPTALICYNDLAAAGVYRAARERGLRIPGDLSVTGFDDIELAEVFGPPLTTVKQPCLAMGARMAELVLEELERKKGGVGPREPGNRFRGELVVRGSTAPPRKENLPGGGNRQRTGPSGPAER